MRLTVGHLSRMLEEMDKDLPILLEGCDCVGWAAGVALATQEEDPPDEPRKRCCYIARDCSRSGQHRYLESVHWRTITAEDGT